MKKQLQVKISGKVQGVFFRKAIQEHAKSRYLTGFAKNTDDGCVHAIFEGEESTLQQILLFCNIGPKGAQVSKIEKEFTDYTGEFEEFSIMEE